MKHSNQTWSDYLNSPTVRRPKVFRATIVRREDGTFQVVGGDTRMLDVINQYEAKWVQVDTRDFAAALRRNPVQAL